jgi:phosphoglycolate phosphatase-like HAD superfamily hydrolase
MNNIKAIIFDFDGVIAESVQVKSNAFAEMYSAYGAVIEKKVIAHHEANGGLSRFEKFRFYHKYYLHEDIDSEKVDSLAKQFSDLVLQKVISSPYVRGAYEFILENYKKYDFYISTGTPADEIKVILEKRELSKYFKAVYGSPDTKDKHVKEILANNGYNNDEVVFIGDADTDKNAAKLNNIKFVARIESQSSPLLSERFKVQDLTQLKKIIDTI